MTKKRINTEQAPQAIGPYSQAVQVGTFIYTSGQLPLDRASGTVVAGGIKEQTHAALRHLQTILEAAGSDLNKVVKTLVFLKDMNDFTAFNEVYGSYFDPQAVLPARSAVQVARLPKDALIEIEAVATI